MNKSMKKIVVILILCVLFFGKTTNYTYAMTNPYYGEQVEYEENEQQINTAMNNSDILNYIAQFVYAVGRVIENLVAKLFGSLSGSTYFPWEDKIIFNTIPLLDINFMNPAPHSIFSSDVAEGKVGGVVRSVYFTLLTISISLLSVGMAVMGIRLAISSIAAEKAKYKEAIVKAVYTVIMIFSVHFILSLVFYANEKIVETASSILKSTISDKDVEDFIKKLYSSDLSNIDSFITAQCSGRTDIPWYNIFAWSAEAGQKAGGVATLVTSTSAVTNAGLENYTYATWNGRTFKELSSELGKHASTSDFVTGGSSGSADMFRYSSSYRTIDLNQKIFWYLINNDAYLQWLDNRRSYAAVNYSGPIMDGQNYWQTTYYTAQHEKPQFQGSADNWGFGNVCTKFFGSSTSFRSSNYAVIITSAITMNLTGLSIHSIDSNSISNQYRYNSLTDFGAVKSGYAEGIAHDGPDFYVDCSDIKYLPEEDIKAAIKRNLTDIVLVTYNNGDVSFARTDEDELVNICYQAIKYYMIQDFSTEDVISQLADIFKKGAWTWDDSGKATKYDAIACSLYFILVIQSLMFLFAYIKRLFYVILLSSLGPIVVIYDFFTGIL